MPWWAFTPFIILGVLALVLAIFAILGRWRGGKYLRPIVMQLQRIPLFKRWFMKASIEPRTYGWLFVPMDIMATGSVIIRSPDQMARSRFAPSKKTGTVKQGATPTGTMSICAV